MFATLDSYRGSSSALHTSLIPQCVYNCHPSSLIELCWCSPAAQRDGRCKTAERKTRKPASKRQLLYETEEAFLPGNVHLPKGFWGGCWWVGIGFFLGGVQTNRILVSIITAQPELTTWQIFYVVEFFFPRNAHFAIPVVAGGHFVARAIIPGLKSLLLTLATLPAIGH